MRGWHYAWKSLKNWHLILLSSSVAGKITGPDGGSGLFRSGFVRRVLSMQPHWPRSQPSLVSTSHWPECIKELPDKAHRHSFTWKYDLLTYGEWYKMLEHKLLVTRFDTVFPVPESNFHTMHRNIPAETAFASIQDVERVEIFTNVLLSLFQVLRTHVSFSIRQDHLFLPQYTSAKIRSNWNGVFLNAKIAWFITDYQLLETKTNLARLLFLKLEE